MRGLSCAVIACAFSSVAAGLEVSSDTGRPEGVAADLRLEARVGRSTADHPPHVDAVHRQTGEDTGLADGRTKEGSTALSADPGRIEVLVEVALELKRHEMPALDG